MKAGILTIGHELLTGFTTDTNSAWIGQKLLNAGIPVAKKLSVDDSEEDIHDGLALLNESVDVIIVTGGLGPTHDDRTQAAIFNYFRSKTSFDEEYWDELKKRYGTVSKSISELNRNQALVPDNGVTIPNLLGTARGLHFIKKKKHFFFTPGVPAEMKGMMTDTILPLLESMSDSDLYYRTLRTAGIPEAKLVEILGNDRIHSKLVNVSFLPQSPGVDIRISSSVQENLTAWADDVHNLLGKRIYGENTIPMEQVVVEMLMDKNQTLSVAESCTGGFLGHRITGIPGSSRVFMGGVIAYDNKVKMNLLGISEFELNTFGAVSPEIGRHMAEGVRDLMKSDYGIGITGIAGPAGGTDDKPVGLVYVGLATPVETIVKKFQFKSNRKFNKLLATENALNLLRLYLIDHE